MKSFSFWEFTMDGLQSKSQKQITAENTIDLTEAGVAGELGSWMWRLFIFTCRECEIIAALLSTG